MELRFPEYLSPVQRRKLHDKLKEKLRDQDDIALDLLAEAMVNLVVARFKQRREEYQGNAETDEGQAAG